MQSWWALSALRCKQCTRIPRHPSTFTHENSTYTVNMVLTWESPDLWLSHCRWGGSLRVAWCACMCGKPQKPASNCEAGLVWHCKAYWWHPWFPGLSWQTFLKPDSWVGLFQIYLLLLWSKCVGVHTVTEMKCYSREIHRHLVSNHRSTYSLSIYYTGRLPSTSKRHK